METERVDTRISASEELAEHYQIVKDFRDNLVGNADEDPKVIATALATLNTTLRDVSKMQRELYTAENFALLQQRIVNVLRDVSPEICEKVLNGFEEDLRRLS